MVWKRIHQRQLGGARVPEQVTYPFLDEQRQEGVSPGSLIGYGQVCVYGREDLRRITEISLHAGKVRAHCSNFNLNVLFDDKA